jgi:hypothetical protein
MVEMATSTGSLIALVLSLLVGALGIYVGGRVITDASSYVYAFVTALIGAVVWAVIGFFVDAIPLLGILAPILALIALIWVINWRYPGGWISAIAIAIIGWVAILVVRFVLGLFDIVTFGLTGAL